MLVWACFGDCGTLLAFELLELTCKLTLVPLVLPQPLLLGKLPEAAILLFEMHELFEWPLNRDVSDDGGDSSDKISFKLNALKSIYDLPLCGEVFAELSSLRLAKSGAIITFAVANL